MNLITIHNNYSQLLYQKKSQIISYCFSSTCMYTYFDNESFEFQRGIISRVNLQITKRFQCGFEFGSGLTIWNVSQLQGILFKIKFVFSKGLGQHKKREENTKYLQSVLFNMEIFKKIVGVHSRFRSLS